MSDQLTLKENAGVLRSLLDSELAAGIMGLRLFIACVTIAAFMMTAIWALGDGLTKMLERGGITFLGGDVAVTTTNVPLDGPIQRQLRDLGDLSVVAELRSSATSNETRVAVEVKGVDNSYPLYGTVQLQSGRAFADVMNATTPSVVVEEAFLSRTNAQVGDIITLGSQNFEIADVLLLEPDRLSAGRFMVGPRVLTTWDHVADAGLIQRGSLIEYRYRIRATGDSPTDLNAAVQSLRPEAGWEFETPADAGDRVQRTVGRTTTFLGMAGIVAFAIGMTGAWAAAQAWVARRGRTIALYRLSGASPSMILALHGAIVAIASLSGMIIGLITGGLLAAPLLELITTRLHVEWTPSDMIAQLATVTAILTVGLIGTGLLALSGAARIAPGAAMRSGETDLSYDARHAAVAIGCILLAVGAATLSLPIAWIAGVSVVGLIGVVLILALAAALMARIAAKRNPTGFIATVTNQGLSKIGNATTRAVAIGIGIAGITAIVASQTSMERALQSELPERIPDVVLIDVQPDQVEGVKARINADPALGGLQADPFMRMTITAVNGVPAEEALINPDKSWVIEGDRSFSWTAQPTGAELLAGEWWAEDYSGPPLLSPEEDVYEAFDLKPGDTMTYSVLGRSFTSEVVNIRKEYHRTFRPEFLMVASPQPFQNAPQTWIMSLQGETDGAVDSLIRDLGNEFPNVTSIDIRRIIEQVTSIIENATMASLSVAIILILTGALSLTAVAAAEVDSRRRESIAFTLIGASRKEIALARLTEAASVGAIAAIIGGGAGLIGGYFIVGEALRVDWAPGLAAILLPLILGVAASVAAGLAGGMGAAPRGPGQMVRYLTT